ncbi:unnamed protein product [Paramecium octaurelia]|uniref:Fungal lipase-type domain-containing protein n=1 Tax=Paramecium octaurelia TaxID=43137 RepID=A0A8S1USY4_PAROT|nr:unnamed protein product [Paramecium octaurelia]
MFIIYLFSVAHAYFSKKLAHDLYLYTKIAVCDTQQIKEWNCGYFCDQHPDMDSIKVIESDKHGVLSYVGINQAENRIIVTFRSTQNLLNFINDLKFMKQDYPCYDCKVHSGFMESYLDIKEDLLKQVNELSILNPKAQLTITGHSLGAALATLAAIDLTNIGLYIHTFYIFGSPRVGNKAFAEYFSKKITTKDKARVTHFSDLVPHLPPQSLDYIHAVPEFWFNQDFKEYQQCEYSQFEDDKCSNSMWSHSIRDHRDYFNIKYRCNDSFYQKKTKEQIIL